ncbi:unnamed protein product [Macrosiphum euphorbiae]|uniref:PiggyBac transposable element-derived protein domain-containing protein n=1 Tax=Macrosiphum euphorbiae TaxID=13131 RepID=A0AAV0XY83_9HEMI|nr:unnamed protein product [Macrosiphum euphorbiae]
MEMLGSDDSSGSDFEDSDDFEPSDKSSSDDDYESHAEGNNILIPNTDPDDESEDESNNIVIPNIDPHHVIWSKPPRSFTPHFTIPDDRKPEVLVDLESGCLELTCFQKIFPRSLYIFISQCTNERLQILRDKKKKTKDEIRDSDSSEIMLTLGCLLVMSYNKLLNVYDCWSKNPSMGNQEIKMAMVRNRFQLLMSKLYFNHPKPPTNASKTYYIDEMVNCLKHTFLNARGESPFQS